MRFIFRKSGYAMSKPMRNAQFDEDAENYDDGLDQALCVKIMAEIPTSSPYAYCL